MAFTRLEAQKTDPYHLDSGGFGRLIYNTGKLDIWWCEGAYKIMKNTRVPEQKGKIIELWSAKNEYEPFQLVFHSQDTIKNLALSVDDLKGPYGSISGNNIELRQLEYVRVTKPTDSYGYRGFWPDPLPQLPGKSIVTPGTNFTVWANVYIPATAMPGIYKGNIKISADDFKAELPLRITVWDFTLPTEPSMRSGFGLSVDKIADYHNITDRDELKTTFDLYMQAFREYKIAPYSFYYLYPVIKNTKGVSWQGGLYDSNTRYSGKYSLKIEDESKTEASFATNTDFIKTKPGESYLLKWKARSESPEQQYTILLEGYDSSKNRLVFENKADIFIADTTWKSAIFRLGSFGPDVNFARLYLYPAFRTAAGEETGSVWFDEISFSTLSADSNLLSQGDIEVNTDSINISLDFTEFDLAASRYLDDFGFNGFRLNLEGLGSGTYYSREDGIFEGFIQGTAEYKKLMSLYLSQIQEHLKEKGWLGKEYVYWFDEPGEKDYPFVREGMELIKESAPEITTFLTENDPGPEIMDVTDITCTIWHRIDPEKARKVREGGQGYWSYLCTAPKAPWVSEFIDHDAINLRIWLWMSYAYRLNGILIWSSNYWTSRDASPPGYLQNPWEEPASFVQGYGWPLGKQTLWGNGDGRFWYPPNRDPNNDNKKYIEGPVPSIRLEFLRQGLEDYEYFVMLENLLNTSNALSDSQKRKISGLLNFPSTLFTDGKTYTKNPADLLEYRKEIAKMIVSLTNQN